MKKSVTFLLVFALLASALTACGPRDTAQGSLEQEQYTDTAIYYINADKTGIESEEYDITNPDALAAAEELLQELSKEATDVEHNPAIPEGVAILSDSLEEDVLYLNLSEAYAQMPRTEQTLSRAAIVDSLVQIEGIRGVYFMVEGVPLTDSDGNEIGVLDADSFVQNIGSTVNTYQTAELRLYFANEKGDGLNLETKSIRYSSNVSLEKLIVEQLMKGPTNVGNYRTINPNTTILGVTIRDGICYVNLDETFLTNEYDVKPETTIYSLVNSLIDGVNVTSVQISVNGDTNVSYMETVDLSQPFTENSDYIKKES